MTAADLPAVSAVAAVVHVAYPEDDVVAAERLRLFPDGCLAHLAGGRVTGYALAHPWRAFSIPALDTLLGAIPADADVLYLHDVALLPGARGGGAARAAVGRLAAVAARRGLGRMALTAVAGTAGIWGRLGFVAAEAPALAAKLATYGPGAAYMLTRPPDRR
jgi:GNAT superfamily N-acetyltransferase